MGGGRSFGGLGTGRSDQDRIVALMRHLGIQLDISCVAHPDDPERYAFRCHLRCVALPAKRGFHRPLYGWGETPQRALENHIEALRGRTVVIHPYPSCKEQTRRFRISRKLSA